MYALLRTCLPSTRRCELVKSDGARAFSPFIFVMGNAHKQHGWGADVRRAAVAHKMGVERKREKEVENRGLGGKVESGMRRASFPSPG